METGRTEKIRIMEGEYWYGGFVHGSKDRPFHGKSSLELDLTTNGTPNQAAPLLLSSKGRSLWGKEGFCIRVQDGEMALSGSAELLEGSHNLRGAYLEAMKRYFPFREIHLSDRFFTAPVYNSWIELTFYQNEKDILRYADDILQNGFAPGVLMIDDGWSDYYGKWSFNRERFPNAENMISRLHELGFALMLWICPFITPDTLPYREAKDKGYLILNEDGSVLITEWWNGYSAALDLSNPKAADWLGVQLNRLIDLGVDGFKLDAGDCYYYRRNQRTFGNVTPEEMSRLWCEFGEQFAYNEFRAAWCAGGMSLMQRLCDKPHSWEADGIPALLPDTLAQGILGMPFGSPDMIGGGEYLNFQENSTNLDQELFVRHSEIAALMPVMQFSAAPWRVLDQEHLAQIMKTVKIREENLDYLMCVLEESKRTGEPVVRYMEYEFPGQGLETVTDQFMLGARLLVAPGYEKGKRQRTVIVPAGNWELCGEAIQSGTHTLDSLPGEPIMIWKK